MNHLSDEELIEHYYESAQRSSSTGHHLEACAECAASYAALRRDLDGIQPLTPPLRSEAYGEQVWSSIRGSVHIYEPRRRAWLSLPPWKPLVWTIACTLLVAAAFLAGRQWQRRQTPDIAMTNDPQARQRVVVLVLGDHLERSERLLVELNHANAGDLGPALQGEARELLAANRLVRQSARQAPNQTGDPAVDASLDRLERLLVELSNQPDGASEADLDHLRKEMNTDGLLFDVRVLRTHVARQESPTVATKGVSL